MPDRHCTDIYRSLSIYEGDYGVGLHDSLLTHFLFFLLPVYTRYDSDYTYWACADVTSGQTAAMHQNY